MRTRTLFSAAAVLGVAFLTSLGLTARADIFTPIGSAYAVKATILTLGINPTPAISINAGNSWNAQGNVASLTPTLLGSSLSFTGLHTESSGSDVDGSVHASSTVAAANVTVGTPPLGVPGIVTVTADTITANCQSIIRDQVDRFMSFTDLTVNVVGFGNVTIPADPAPNTGISLGALGSLILNEQYKNPDNSYTINAFHLQLVGANGVDLVLASATCSRMPLVIGVPLFGF